MTRANVKNDRVLLLVTTIAVLFVFSNNCYAITPTISSVKGTIQTGQKITITGTNMLDEDKTNWTSMFKTGSSYGFEGTSPTSDKYSNQGGNDYDVVYDSSVRLMGNNSIKFQIEGASSNCPYGNLGSASYITVDEPAREDYYVRLYARWNSRDNLWASSHIKMLYDLETYYFQPAAGSNLPSEMNVNYDGTRHDYDIPSGTLQNNRWYCFEVRWKKTPPYRYTAWVDGVQIADDYPSRGAVSQYLLMGLINACGTESGFYLDHWWDNFAVSTSRINPSCIIEVGNSSNYDSPLKKWQAPVYLSDGSVQINLDLEGLGNGPYYLWITNNKQERSSAFKLGSGSVAPADPDTSVILFEETFESSNMSSRGWYDNTAIVLSTSEHITGSTASAEYRFLKGSTQPVSGGAMRRKIIENDSLYVSYYIKHSANWIGSNRSYHPHQFMILTNENGEWDGLAYTHLTTYIEENSGRPVISIQDGQNIDETRVGQNLVDTTEFRSVAGCNGDSDGYGGGSCYFADADTHWNGKTWIAPAVYFSDSTGSYYKGDWHLVEAYIKLNSISGGKAVRNGVIQYWYDGNLIMNYNDVVFRTGQYPGMKFNQFVIAPWMSDGSPVDQTFWIDNLTIATSRPGGDNGLDTTSPAIPTGIQAQPVK